MAHRGRMNEFKPQIEPNAGPQPKKRRKNAGAAAAARSISGSYFVTEKRLKFP